MASNEPLLPAEDDEQVCIKRAAWQLEDSITGCPRTQSLVGREDIAKFYPCDTGAREAHLKVVNAEKTYNTALGVMILLSIFERPSWCEQDLDMYGVPEGEDRCTYQGDRPMVSGIAYLPPFWTIVIEIFLMCIFAKKYWLEYQINKRYFSQGPPYQSHKLVTIGVLSIVFEACDIFMFFYFPKRKYRLVFLARMGYLAVVPAVVALVNCVVACFTEFASIAVFLAGFMLFYAWISVTMLKDLHKGVALFSTFPRALNSMFVAGVSDDFVAVFIRSYSIYRWVGLFWVAFLVFAHILLLSLVLDTLVSAFLQNSRKTKESMIQQRAQGMLNAFNTLVQGHDDKLSEQRFLAFVEEFIKSKRVYAITRSQAELMFKALDEPDAEGNRDCKLSWVEFTQLIEVVMQYKIWSTNPHSIFGKKYLDRPWYQKYKMWVVGDDDEDDDDATQDDNEVMDKPKLKYNLERCMYVVLVSNLILVFIETYYDLSDYDAPVYLDTLELVFSFIYLFQFLLKVSVLSLSEYMASVSNRFDFFTTWLLLLTGLIERIWGGEVATYANVFRLLRLLRMVRNLKNFDKFQFMIDILSTMFSQSKEMMIFLGTVVFFFTMLSVQIFGGEMREGNAALDETEYLENHMMILNCNDVPLAFGVWFVMLLQEYQPIFADATANLSPYPWWLLFPCFYIIGVSVAFELLKAFTIQVYTAYKKQKEADKEAKLEKAKKKATSETAEKESTEKGKEESVKLSTFRDQFYKVGQKLHTRVICDREDLKQIKQKLATLRPSEPSAGAPSVE